MDAIQGLSGVRDIAQISTDSIGSGRPRPPREHEHGLPPQAGAITNEDGQSLLDIQDELREAVSAALEDADGEGDLLAIIHDAISAALEANGFDPEEVEAAMAPPERGARPPMRPMAESGASAAAAPPPPPSEDGEGEMDFVEGFLRQLRSGANLDVEG